MSHNRSSGDLQTNFQKFCDTLKQYKINPEQELDTAQGQNVEEVLNKMKPLCSHMSRRAVFKCWKLVELNEDIFKEITL